MWSMSRLCEYCTIMYALWRQLSSRYVYACEVWRPYINLYVLIFLRLQGLFIDLSSCVMLYHGS